MHLSNILVIIAIAIFAVAVIVGSRTPDTWKWTGITWSILMVGLIVFATAMTIS